MRTSAVTLLVAIALATSGCGNTVTEQRSIEFSEGQIELTRTSRGGATGDELIKLKFDNSGEISTFFEGSNFSQIEVTERAGKIVIQLCGGKISNARPFRIGGTPESHKYKYLDIDWSCKGDFIESDAGYVVSRTREDS